MPLVRLNGRLMAEAEGSNRADFSGSSIHGRSFQATARHVSRPITRPKARLPAQDGGTSAAQSFLRDSAAQRQQRLRGPSRFGLRNWCCAHELPCAKARRAAFCTAYEPCLPPARHVFDAMLSLCLFKGSHTSDFAEHNRALRVSANENMTEAYARVREQRKRTKERYERRAPFVFSFIIDTTRRKVLF